MRRQRIKEQRHQEAQEQQKRWAASQEKAQRDREVSEAKALQAQKEREAADRERARLAEQQRQEVAERERERMAHEEAMAEMRMVKDMTDLERSTAEHHFTTNTNGYRIDGLASPVYAVNEQGEEGRLYVISASKPVFDPSTFGYVRASFYFDFFMSGKTVVAWNRRTVGMPTTICKAVPNHPLVAPRVVRPHNSPPPSTQPPIRRGNSPPPSMQPRRTR